MITDPVLLDKLRRQFDRAPQRRSPSVSSAAAETTQMSLFWKTKKKVDSRSPSPKPSRVTCTTPYSKRRNGRKEANSPDGRVLNLQSLDDFITADRHLPCGCS